eukprot:scaffold22381_cov118-Isochrysis_galbana.AAC.4
MRCSHQAVAVCRLAGRLKQAAAAHCAGNCGRRPGFARSRSRGGAARHLKQSGSGRPARAKGAEGRRQEADLLPTSARAPEASRYGRHCGRVGFRHLDWFGGRLCGYPRGWLWLGSGRLGGGPGSGRRGRLLYLRFELLRETLHLLGEQDELLLLLGDDLLHGPLKRGGLGIDCFRLVEVAPLEVALLQSLRLRRRPPLDLLADR